MIYENLIAGIRDLRPRGFTLSDRSLVIDDFRFVSGFRQNQLYPTGMEWIRESLRWMVREEFPLADVRFQSHLYSEDFRAVAAEMARTYRPYLAAGYTVRIRFVCYSWGVGRGAVRLARHLKKLGFEVEIVYSIDGVYYHTLLRWRAMASPILSPLIGVPTIRFASNVRRVKMWRQREDYPRGHDIVIEDENGVATSVGVEGRDRFLSLGHCAIDESVEILNAIKKDLRAALSGNAAAA